MSNILLFSDLHIHPHKKNLDRLEDCLKIIPWVFDTAKKHQVKNIIFGGDFFHDRQKIDIYTYQRAFDTLNNNIKNTDITLWILLGNHDLWFYEDSSISSVHPFSEIKGVKVVSKPSRFKIENLNWDFLPFTTNPLSSLKLLDSIEGEKQCLIGHIALNQAKMHKGFYATDILVEHEGEMISVDSDLFMEYEQVFLGHFHSEQKVNAKVEYIGSPLQLSFGEAFEEKHIIILNSETRKKEYIKNEFSPKHFIIKENELSKYDLKNNFVQLVVEDISKVDLVDLKKNIIKNSNVADLKIKYSKSVTVDNSESIDGIKDVLYNDNEMLTKYIDQVKTELDKKVLIEIGKKICEYNKEQVS